MLRASLSGLLEVPPSLEWTQVRTTGAVPSQMISHSATAFDERFIAIIGGRSLLGEMREQPTILDTETMQWTNGPAMGKCNLRIEHTASLMGDCIWVIGGREPRDGEWHAASISVCTYHIRLHSWATHYPSMQDQVQPLMYPGNIVRFFILVGIILLYKEDQKFSFLVALVGLMYFSFFFSA